MTEFNAKPLKKNQVLIIGSLLLFTLVTTRSHFFNHIQDASWAIFFLAGFYLRGSVLSRLGFPLFFLVSFITDLVVIDAQGGVHYCFTQAYAFLVPAYGALWLAGHWFANHYAENVKGLVYFVVAALVGITVCDVLSSGGFYFFSERFTDTNMTEFVSRIQTYLPIFMKPTMMYLGLAALIHIGVKQLLKANTQVRSSS